MLLLDSLKTICATRCPFQMSKISDLYTKQILIIRRCIWFTELRRMAAQASHAKHRSLPLQVSYHLGTHPFALFSARFDFVWSSNADVRQTRECVKPAVFLSDLSGRDQLESDTVDATTTSSAAAAAVS